MFKRLTGLFRKDSYNSQVKVRFYEFSDKEDKDYIMATSESEAIKVICSIYGEKAKKFKIKEIEHIRIFLETIYKNDLGYHSKLKDTVDLRIEEGRINTWLFRSWN